jgi:hypothetical protein
MRRKPKKQAQPSVDHPDARLSPKSATYSAATRERVLQLREEGLSYRAVQRVLADEGITPPPSLGWIRSVLVDPTPIVGPRAIVEIATASAPEPAAKPRPKRPTPPKAAPPPAAPPDRDSAPRVLPTLPTPEPDLPEGATMAERAGIMLERTSMKLLTMLQRADASGDPQVMATAARLLTSTLAELRKAAPDEVPEDPDALGVVPGEAMRAAAERGRDKLREQLERLLADRAKWPHCPTCGGRMRP